jgi:hypothetical protein
VVDHLKRVTSRPELVKQGDVTQQVDADREEAQKILPAVFVHARHDRVERAFGNCLVVSSADALQGGLGIADSHYA